MARQKLTPEKRALLRKELAAKFKAGIPRVKILKSLSDKYGISTEGMRWYYKDASGNGTPKQPAAPAKTKRAAGRRRAPKASIKKANHQGRPTKAAATRPSRNGNSLHLPELLGRLTEKVLKGLLAAKRLVPSLEASRRREGVLRAQVRDLGLALRAESTKGRKLQRQIKKLAQL